MAKTAIIIVGGVVVTALIVAAYDYRAPNSIIRSAFLSARSLCSEDGVKRTVVGMIEKRLKEPSAVALVEPSLAAAVARSVASIKLGGISYLGAIEGNGGSRCAGQVEVMSAGRWEPATINADYTVEYSEDKKTWVRARFAPNR